MSPSHDWDRPILTAPDANMRRNEFFSDAASEDTYRIEFQHTSGPVASLSSWAEFMTSEPK